MHGRQCERQGLRNYSARSWPLSITAGLSFFVLHPGVPGGKEAPRALKRLHVESQGGWEPAETARRVADMFCARVERNMKRGGMGRTPKSRRYVLAEGACIPLTMPIGVLVPFKID